jgi:autotransporter-associated beta strand protein
MSRRKLVARAAAFAAAGILAGRDGQAMAASSSWTSTSPGIWSNPANWSAGTPGSTTALNSTDVATFNAANGVVVTLDQPTQDIGGITFGGAGTAYNIGSTSGNPLFISAGGTINDSITSTAAETINAPLILEGATTFNNSAGTNALVFNGNITAAGSLSLSAGAVTLNGNAAFSGLTTVSLGTLNLTGNDASASTGGISMPNTASATASTSIINILGGGSLYNAGPITMSSINAAAINNEIVVGSSATSTGTVTDSNSVSVGKLSEINIQAGGLWNQTGSNAFTLGPTSATSTNYSSLIVVAGIFNDTQTVPFNLAPSTPSGKTGDAFLNISGGLFITAQPFNYSTAALSATSNIILLGGGIISLTSNITALTNSATTGYFQVSNGVISTNGFNTSLGTVVSNYNSSAGSFGVIGGGTLTLTATNTYTGTTSINQAATLNLPSGGLINSSSPLSAGGGTLALGGTGNQTFAGVTLGAGAFTITDTNSGTLALGAITRSIGGTIDFGSAGTITTSATTTNGIIGGYATIGGGANWATVSGGTATAYGNAGTYYNTSSNVGNNAAAYAGMNIDITSSPTLTSAITPYTLRFNTAASNIVTLSGTNTITGGVLVTPSVLANAQTITGGTLEGASGGDLIVNQYDNSTGAGLTIASVIADNTTATGFTKSGFGTVTLSGANTYSGMTYVNSGTLIVNNYATNTANGAYTVATGATLKIGYVNYLSGYDKGITVNGSGLSSSAGLYFLSGVTWNMNGILSLVTAPTNVSTYGGTGIAIFEGLDPTVSNNIQITTAAQASGSTLSSTISIATRAHGFGVSVAEGGNNSTGDLVINGAITGTGNYSTGTISAGFTKAGNGSLLLTGSNTYTSGTAVEAGQLILSGGSNRLSPSTTVQLGSVISNNTSGAQLLLNGISQQLSGLVTWGTSNDNSVLGNSSTASTLILNVSSPDAYTGYLGGSAPNNNNFSLTVASTNASSPGTLTLSSQNTFANGTTVSSGTLIVAASNAGTISGALGPSSATVTLGDANTGTSSPTLQLTGGYTLSNPITISSLGSGTPTLAATGSSSSTFSGAITLNQALTVNNTNSAVPTSTYTGATLTSSSLTFSGAITGTGGITFTGGETTNLTSTASSYSGPVVITASSLVQFSTNASTSAGSQLNISSGTAVVANLSSGSFGGLIGSGAFSASSTGTSSISIGALNDASDNFSGIISGTLSLTKVGTGTQIFSGANTYSGTTNISAGTFSVANTTGSGTGTSVVTLTGGTLASGTVGSISGSVTAAASAEIAPGGINSSIGALTLGGLTTASGTNLNFDLGAGPATTIGSSSVVTNGDLLNLGTTSTNIASGTRITLGSQTPVGGDDYRLIGGTAVSGITLSNFSLPTPPMGDTYALSTAVDPGYIDLVVGVLGPANLTWDNAGGTGNGTSWDTTSQNWNNGSAATTFSNTSNTSNGDNVTFNDSNNAHYNVIVTSAGVTPNTITVNTAATYNLSGGSIGGGGGLTLTAGTLNVANTTQNAWGSTTVNGGTLILANNTALPINQTLTIASGATVQVTSHSGGPSNVTVLQVGTLNNSGTIDLTNNSLAISSGSTVSSITTEVKAAYNGGSWTGTSSTGGVITSTTAAADTTYLTAVGVATGLTSFDGITVPSTDILVKYTYYGDTNLDGAVDGSDYTNIDNGFNNHLTGWQNGDFNYDSIVDGSDYTLIDNAYNMQGNSYGTNSAALIASATAQIAGPTSAVPEPTTVGLLGIGAVGLLARRRRRH